MSNRNRKIKNPKTENGDKIQRSEIVNLITAILLFLHTIIEIFILNN